MPGLQGAPCVADDGTLVEADRYVTRAGLDGGGQPICIVRVGCIS